MHIILIFIFSFVISLSAISMENSPIEIPNLSTFINLKDNSIEFIVKKYEKEGNTVILLPASHIAEKQFYKSIELLIKDKVVIYESYGDSHENFMNLCQQLPKEYKELNKIRLDVRNNFSKLEGYVEQDVLSYDSCKEIIHADTVLKYPAKHALPENVDDFKRALEEEYLTLLLNRLNELEYVHYCFDFFNFKFNIPILDYFHFFIKDNIKIANIVRQAVNNFKHNKEIDVFIFKKIYIDIFKKETLSRQEMFTELKNVMQKYITQGFSLSKEACEECGIDAREMILGRNEYIYGALKKQWEHNNNGSELIVLYGATHMPFVEQFLLNNGYKLSEETKTLTVMSL